ncbi:MAG TPA: DUF1778 domain-containing protein [Rhizomicrobium sp.]|jgi:uncharacterized protein (DUF1778 family)|nr:DUF1778 domain-containing protein [Rhizomicrobium sp.]
MSRTIEAKSERVDLRMTPAAKRTLQQAAAVVNKTVSEFLLDSSLTAAFEALADRRVFQLDEARWNAFVAALVNPPKHNAGLCHLLAHKPGWGK